VGADVGQLRARGGGERHHRRDHRARQRIVGVVRVGERALQHLADARGDGGDAQRVAHRPDLVPLVLVRLMYSDSEMRGPRRAGAACRGGAAAGASPRTSMRSIAMVISGAGSASSPLAAAPLAATARGPAARSAGPTIALARPGTGKSGDG